MNEQTSAAIPNRRPWLTLAVICVACVGLALFAWTSFSPPAPGFISVLKGRPIERPWPIDQPLGNGVTYYSGFPIDYFAFDGDSRATKAAIIKALHQGDSPDPGFLALPGDDGTVVHLYDSKAAKMPGGATLVVVILGRKSWLQRQWDRVAAKF